MTKGKPWTPEQEKQLKDLVEAKTSVPAIVKTLEKSRDSIIKKCSRLGLEVVGVKKKNSMPSSSEVGLVLPSDLDSVEQILLVLSGAVSSLRKGGLEKVEIMRLRSIIAGCKVYKEMLADYMDYRGLEVEMLEWKAKYEQLAKKGPGVSS